MIFRFSSKSSPDYFFLEILLVLIIFGLVMLTSASSDIGRLRFGDSYYYIKHQLLYGLLLGIIGFLIGLFIDFRFLEKLAPLFLILSIISLILVFTPLGFKSGGSERWLSLGPLSFQPGELLKLTFLIYLSSWLSRNLKRSKSFTQGFLPFLFLAAIVSLLLFLQPATTTAIIILAASLIMYFTAGAKIKFLVALVLVTLLGVAVLITVTPYRFQRITSWLTSFKGQNADILGKGYHLNQALIAIGSGRIFGVGYGQSTTKINYLPGSIDDSIFAVIAEELGFVGSAGLVFLFLLFIWRGINIAAAAPDNFSRYLVTSFISLIGLQAFINIGAISGLIPLTGIPLPFISYGGTALAVFLTMSGIILNISRWRLKK